MKKSTLLSLATVGTIVATSIGTFAAWDTTEASSTGTVAVGSPTIVSTTDMSTFTPASRTINVDPTFTSTVTFNVSDTDQVANTLTLSPTLKDDQGTVITAERATVTLSQDGDTITNGVDSNLASDGTNTYNVEVKVMDKTLATKNLTVEVKGVLSKVNPAS